jgi:hypothetical protein
MIDKPKLLVREKDIEQAIKILIKGAYIKNWAAPCFVSHTPSLVVFVSE